MHRDAHTPIIATRENSVLVDASCSCGGWNVKNRTREDVRTEHGEHLQRYLGPDAQMAREAMYA